MDLSQWAADNAALITLVVVIVGAAWRLGQRLGKVETGLTAATEATDRNTEALHNGFRTRMEDQALQIQSMQIAQASMHEEIVQLRENLRQHLTERNAAATRASQH